VPHKAEHFQRLFEYANTPLSAAGMRISGDFENKSGSASHADVSRQD
jgi:hypothetical protein